jgi:transcriptional regulator with XRE-family HTH domain
VNIDAAETIGDRIRVAREAAGISQEDIGSRLGVSRAAVSQWETKEAKPGIARLQQIGAILGATLEWLVAGDGTGPSSIPVTAALRQLRLRAGLSMADLAEAIELKGPSSYQRYEDEALYKSKFIPVETVKRLAGALVGMGEPPIAPTEVWALAGLPPAINSPDLVRIEISQRVTVDQAARIFAILNERQP